MVVSASRPASLVGQRVLQEGGNAVDAAVATAFALAVTWPEAGNIGGGGFMLVYPPQGEPVVIDYREAAPLRAHRTMFHQGDSPRGHKTVATPGTVKGLAAAHARFGRLSWYAVVEPAVALARDGFFVDDSLAASLNDLLSGPQIAGQPQYAELRRVYGHPERRPWCAGDRLVLPDLASTLEQIARQGGDAFYRGRIADQIVAEMQSGGGWIGYQDLAAYEVFVRTPISIRYGEYTVLAPPPPSSGGVCLAWMLSVLERHQLKQYPRYSPTVMHLVTETMRRAYRERARWLADPSFATLPGELFTAEFADRLAASIDPNRVTASEELAGDIPLADEPTETTHFSIVDAEGMAVANTYTLEASYGSGIVVHGAGFLLNNEMGDFNWFPGKTNRHGLIGTPANQIAPAKRMLSSQTPTVVLYQGKPFLVTGTPGGRTIINTVLTILLNVLEFDMDLPTAISHPRMHHQWFPDELVIEQNDVIAPSTLEALRKMGHRVVVRRGYQGSAHSIWIDPRTGERVGVADGRRGGAAAGTNQVER